MAIITLDVIIHNNTDSSLALLNPCQHITKTYKNVLQIITLVENI